MALAEKEPIVKPAVGFYPVDAVIHEMRAAGVDYPRDGLEVSSSEGIESVREHAHKAIAVGEIGLDGYWVPEAFLGKTGRCI